MHRLPLSDDEVTRIARYHVDCLVREIRIRGAERSEAERIFGMAGAMLIDASGQYNQEWREK